MDNEFPSESEMADDPKAMAKALIAIRKHQTDLAGLQQKAAIWTGFGLGLVYGAWDIAKHFLHIP